MPAAINNVPQAAADEQQQRQQQQTTEETSFNENMSIPQLPPSFNEAGTDSESVSLGYYLRSIVFMPRSLRMVCLTNLFCWMAHVCYSLYFTDFVGEAVYGGDPKATVGSFEQIAYEEGVRFGCWGMAMYSLSCACYSLVIERLIEKYGAKRVYVGGLCFYAVGMAMMALTRYKFSVIVFSWTAGVMYSTLFTMPYLLVANYHNKGVVRWAVRRRTQLLHCLTRVREYENYLRLITQCCMGSHHS